MRSVCRKAGREGEGAKTTREGWFYSFRTACGAQSVRSTRKFRAALAVFRRKMEAGADKTESTFAVGKYVCGGRLKKLFEKSFLRIFKNFPAFLIIKNASVLFACIFYYRLIIKSPINVIAIEA